MFKNVILACALLCASLSMNAQEYYHGIGGQYNFGIFNIETQNNSFSGAGSVPGLFYKATLAFPLTKKINLAASSYPFLGLSGNFNSQTGASGSIGAELPVLAELYLGDMDNGCFFMGTGVSAAFLGVSDPDPLFGGSFGGAIIGPQVDMGGQFNFRNNLVGVKVAYTYGLNNSVSIPSDEVVISDRRNMFSIGAYYLF